MDLEEVIRIYKRIKKEKYIYFWFLKFFLEFLIFEKKN